jgi:hypothetical protein
MGCLIHGRVVPAQSLHLSPFRFAHRRIVPDYIPGHRGLFGTASTLELVLTLLLTFRFYQRLHLCTEMLQPDDDQRLLHPRGFREKPAQPTQAGRITHFAQHSRKGALPFALHQPQQYGNARTGIVAWRTPNGNARQSGALRASRQRMGCGIRHLRGLSRDFCFRHPAIDRKWRPIRPADETCKRFGPKNAAESVP